MKLTTIDIIKILPFEKKFQAALLDKYPDKLNPDQKFDIEQTVWDLYEALYNLQLQENLQLEIERAKNNNEKIDDNLYVKVKKATGKQIESDFYKNTEQTDLSRIRSKLEEIIKKTNK